MISKLTLRDVIVFGISGIICVWVSEICHGSIFSGMVRAIVVTVMVLGLAVTLDFARATFPSRRKKKKGA